MLIRRAAAVVAVCGIGLAGGLAGCGSADPIAPAGPITLALITDRDSPAGADALRAAQLAIDVVNQPHPALALPLAAGSGLPGLAGAPLVLAVADTAGRADTTEATLDQLSVAESPVGFVAAETPDVVATAGAYADRRRVPLVDGATSAGFLLEVGLDWYFRVTATDRDRLEAAFALFDAAPAAVGGRSVTVLIPARSSGADLVPLLSDVARGAGYRLGDTITVAGASPPELAEAAAGLAQTPSGPVVAVADSPAEAALVQQVLSQAGPARPVVGLGQGFGVGEATVADLAYPADWSAALTERHPLARAVADLYQRRHQTPMSQTAASVFTATLTLAAAVDSAGRADPAAVRASLRQLSIPATQLIMPWHGVRFGDDGQNQLAAAVVEQHTAEGPTLVHPPELALAPVAWPAAGGTR